MASIVLLLVIATPLLEMRLGLSDAGNNSEEMHSRRAYDLLTVGFGPGLNGPLFVVLENDGGLPPEQLTGIGSALQDTEGVAGISEPIPNAAGNTAIEQVIPASSLQDAAIEDLVHRLRSETLPDAIPDTGVTAYIGGATDANIDLSSKISSQLAVFILVVIGLSVVFLTAVFRSIVVPLKAAVMNLLSVGATFGAVVAVFQWGWFKGLIGLNQTGPVESFLPMVLFGIIFGLSMDYEVFLLTRVREEYEATGDARRSMRTGLASSGRVIAAAGGIMAAVFFAFVLGDARVVKELGFGLGVAIVVDAFLIRLVLVPAVMTLLEARAWFIPAGLDRILAKLNVEGAATAEAGDGIAAPAPAPSHAATWCTRRHRHRHRRFSRREQVSTWQSQSGMRLFSKRDNRSMTSCGPAKCSSRAFWNQKGCRSCSSWG